MKRYAILIVSIIIVLASLTSKFFVKGGPCVHETCIEVAQLPVFAVVVPGLVLSLVAAFIGFRAINLYGGKLGGGLIWMSAGFIFIAGILLEDLPRYAGWVEMGSGIPLGGSNLMQALGMLCIIIGLHKIITVTKQTTFESNTSEN